jgi:hypothetical protein
MCGRECKMIVYNTETMSIFDVRKEELFGRQLLLTSMYRYQEKFIRVYL